MTTNKSDWTYSNLIDASHPVTVATKDSYSADAMAMKLVGERHGKRDLVNLVRWLIIDRAETVNVDLAAK